MSASNWAKFDWQDPFLLEQQLTEEERLIRQTATPRNPSLSRRINRPVHFS